MMKRNAKLLAAVMSVGLVSTAAGMAVAKAGGEDDRADRIERMFERFDADGDGTITRDEAANAPSRFQRADTDGDGGLSVDEMKAAAVERAEKRAERMHERLDANDDGMVDEAEMKAARKAMADRRHARFEGSRHGPRHGYRHGGHRGPRDAGAMFERLDSDGDGAVSREEFDAMRGRRPAE